ncbi:MAG: hypothetical protein ACI8YQ_001361 [Polaribacter sp.]|jgi:hypothetical protein
MLTTDLDGDYKVCIYNVIGNKIISFKANTRLLKLDLSALDSGLYLIEVKEDSRGGGKFAKV